MQNALFPHMEWAKAQHGRPAPTPLGWSGAPHPRGADFEEHGHPEADLERRIARKYGVPKDHVYLVGGTSLGNFIAIAAFSDPGSTVLVETPRYGSLGEIPRGLGCKVLDIPRGRTGRLGPLPAVEGGLLVVSSPHNPTGRLLDEADWTALAAFGDRGGVVLVDEVYRDLQPKPPRVAAARHPRFLTTASFTKSYGLGSLRLGWILGAPDLLARIRRVDNLISVAVAMPSVRVALRHWPRLETYRRAALAPVRANLKALAASGLEFIEPQAGLTAFVRVGDGDAVCSALAAQGVALVPGSFFGAPDWLRIWLGAPKEHFERGLAALRAAVDSRK